MEKRSWKAWSCVPEEDSVIILHLCRRAGFMTMCATLHLVPMLLWLNYCPASTKNGYPINARLGVCVLMVRALDMELLGRLYKLLWMHQGNHFHLYLKEDSVLFFHRLVHLLIAGPFIEGTITITTSQNSVVRWWWMNWKWWLRGESYGQNLREYIDQRCKCYTLPAWMPSWCPLARWFWMAWLASSCLLSPSTSNKYAYGVSCYEIGEAVRIHSAYFPGESALKPEESRMSWNPILNYAVGKLDCPDRGCAVGWYSSTKELITDYFEKEEIVRYIRENDAQDVRLRWLAVALEPQEGYFDQLQFYKTSACFLLCGHICCPQNGNTDFKHTRWGN